jgi:hypothetical protein
MEYWLKIQWENDNSCMYRRCLHLLLVPPLTNEFPPNNIWEFSSYLTGNILLLRYKDQPVIAD